MTVTLEGLVDHSDSLGNAGMSVLLSNSYVYVMLGRYGNGDLQWMTAGKGIVHGEMFPLINKDKPNTMRLFQLW